MRLGKRMTMVLALLLSVIGADVCAQEVVDSVWVDSIEEIGRASCRERV